MAKTWVLDTDTKGTGANMVPLEKTAPREEAPAAPRKRARRRPARAGGSGAAAEVERETRSTPLPPGHVRKKATGEIGRVKAVDTRAGTVTVTWLREGKTSTVPLAGVTRT